MCCLLLPCPDCLISSPCSLTPGRVGSQQGGWIGLGVLPPSPFPRLPHPLPMQLNSREGGLPAGRVDRDGCAAFPRLPHPLPMQLNSREGGLPEVRVDRAGCAAFPRLPHLLPMQLDSREGGLPAGRVDRAGCAASFSLPQIPSHAA